METRLQSIKSPRIVENILQRYQKYIKIIFNKYSKKIRVFFKQQERHLDSFIHRDNEDAEVKGPAWQNTENHDQ